MNIVKKRKVLPGITVITLCGLMSLAYQNCARAKFTIDPAAKSEALGKENVFDRNAGDDGTIVGGVPGNDGAIPGTKNPNGDDPNAAKFQVPVTFAFQCSNARSESIGGNLLTMASLKIVIVNSSNKIMCELSGDFKSEILNKKKLAFTPCATLAPGSYVAHILGADQPSSTFLSKKLNQSNITFTKNADGTFTPNRKTIDIVYDFNNQNTLYAQNNTQYGNTSTSETQKKCDSRVSPLIISMNSEARGIKLTSPLDGIQFDILGENSFPIAHTKKQISWLTPEDQEYYFIVLPNKAGQVLGINEMFGDNTRGPDGKFAANGYAALAKYDDDKDQLITDEDAIFSELRLWADKNRDGVADPNELFTLKEKGLIVIDLNYDKRYKETDQYGNQTLMKSVVKTEDGKLHLMFDLWFRYLNITK